MFSDKKEDIFPILIDHMYRECILTLRPHFNFVGSFEEAKLLVENLKEQLYPDLDNQNFENSENLEVIEEVDSDENDSVRNFESENENDITDIPFNQNENTVAIVESRKGKNPDDLEFVQLFDKMTQDCYQERLKDAILPVFKDISIPIVSKTVKKTYDQLQNPEPVQEESVTFTLMLKSSKSGKQQLKMFQAPFESALAQNLRKQKEMVRQENEKVKRLTLNISERLEEEDYHESLQQGHKYSAVNKNKFYKPTKFKHQKGVPDADIIFH